jgi:tetratricopeptide (TPR) repeat protein
LALITVAGATFGQNEAGVQRIMLQAESLASSGKTAEAIAEYQRVAQSAPESPFAPEALLAAARLYRLDQQGLQAAQLADEITATYPTSLSAAAAAVLRAGVLAQEATDRAMLEGLTKDLETLLLRFDRQRYPALQARAEALTQLGHLWLRLGNPKKASAPLVELLEDETSTDLTAQLASRAELLFAETLLERGQFAAAWQPLQKATGSSDPADAATARAHLSLMHRLLLRPSSGELPWSTARLLAGPSGGFKKPQAIAASTAGAVAVIDSGVGAVLFSSAGARSFTSLRDASRPFFEGESIAFVTPSAIERAGVRDTFTQGGAKPKDLSRIEAAARDGYGSWILVDRSLEGLARFDRGRAWRGELQLTGTPVDVTGDRWGRIYALTSKPSQIHVFSNDLEPLRLVSVPGSRPIALEVDALGNLYVLDQQQSSIRVIDPAQRTLATIGPILPGGVELRSPEDFAIDGAGRIYIADSRLGAVYVVE